MNFKVELMKANFLLHGLLLFILSSTQVQACPQGRSRSNAYIRRDHNRCEGLVDRNITHRSFGLVSFHTTNQKELPKNLSIKVPGTGPISPDIAIQSFLRSYRLDKLDSYRQGSGFAFDADTKLLKRLMIPFSSLRATASIRSSSSLLYYPVILGKAGPRYTFILNAPRNTTIATVEIRRPQTPQPIWSRQLNPSSIGQIRFTWPSTRIPAGRYNLFVQDTNRPRQSRTLQFQHDPNWL